MSAYHGKAGLVYISSSGTGNARSVVKLSDWSLDMATDTVEVTSFGDTNKNYVAGLPDAKGTFTGFYDDATAQMYTAAVDGVARKFYLYPDRNNNPAQYWYGTAFFDFSSSGSVTDALKCSGNWNAATAVTKIG